MVSHQGVVRGLVRPAFLAGSVLALIGFGVGSARAEDCPDATLLIAKFVPDEGGTFRFVAPLGNEDIVVLSNMTPIGGDFTSTLPIGHILLKNGPARDDYTFIPTVFSGTFDNQGLPPQGTTRTSSTSASAARAAPRRRRERRRPTRDADADRDDHGRPTPTPTTRRRRRRRRTPTETTTPATETPTPTDDTDADRDDDAGHRNDRRRHETLTPTATTTPPTETPTPTSTSTSTLTPTPTLTSTPCGETYTGYDIDFNGVAGDPLSDGILIIRYLFKFTGPPLVDHALGDGATRTDPDAIKAYLDCVGPSILDPDGSGSRPLVGGLILIRYFFKFRDGVLIADALDEDNCTRCTGELIEAYIEAILPP